MDTLNPAQQQAVEATDGAVLVIAGAGSGKTRVIEHRVAHLVSKGVAPSRILLLTFTRRAAQQMISRAAGRDPACKDVEGGTFHSFAFRTLRRFSKNLGFDQGFTILDQGDSEEALEHCAARLGFYDRKERFPKKRVLGAVVSKATNTNMQFAEILEREYPQFLPLGEDFETLKAAYTKFKLDANYVDYDDLLLYLKYLLAEDPIRDVVAGAYSHVMVDEYQDTNLIQGEITRLLAAPHGNVMVVGDDAQSIYGFRGAYHGNIMAFPTHFSNCKIIKLEENYRSTQAILDVANAILVNMQSKYSKCMVAVNSDDAMKPELHTFWDSRTESAWGGCTRFCVS